MTQHLEALERGNQIRLKRAAVRRDIASGRVSPAAVLEDVPPELFNMELGDLLRSIHRWGPMRVERFLKWCAISERRKLGELSQGQRGLIARELRGRNSRNTDKIAA